MSANLKAEPGAFDVFLCHNSEDKPEIRRIAGELIRLGVKPWLDEREITPGTLWQSALEEQIANIKSAAIFIGASGIGPWQNMEIRSFINEFVERQCPVIPVLLPSVQAKPNLPILLKNFHAVDFRKSSPDPLQQLVRGIQGERPEAPQLLARGDSAGITRDEGECGLRIYPPLAEPPAREQRSQLFILLNKVKEFWIEGVLNPSLHNQSLIALGKAVSDEAVAMPFNHIVELSGESSRPGPEMAIENVFDASGLLIILGEPGCGKTTTLLELARSLIERAEANPAERIPVVLNLSSWKKGQPLFEWIVHHLSKLYAIPGKIAVTWLEKGYLVPLLDGLDEVSPELQADCVAAVNAFIGQYEPPGLVVCCRLLEYQWLPERLKMNGAISIKPLSHEQIGRYFAVSGPEFGPLKQIVSDDPVLLELAKSPFMLNIMAMTYESAGHTDFMEKAQSVEARREKIFDAYVNEVFRHKASQQAVFSREKVIFGLNWLAKAMQRHSHSIFLLENLQPGWLTGLRQQDGYRIISALSFWAVVSLAIVLLIQAENMVTPSLSVTKLGLALALGLALRSNSGLINGAMCGLAYGLLGIAENGWNELSDWLPNAVFYGLVAGVGIGTLNHIRTVELLTWSWRLFFTNAMKGFGIGAALTGVLSGVGFGLTHGPAEGFKYGLFIGFLCGLLSGFITGMAGGFTYQVRGDKTRPNQGMRLTLRNGVFIGLVATVIVGSVEWLIYGASSTLLEGMVSGLILGLSSGLIIGLLYGLASVIKHYSLRLVLWRFGNSPLKFVPFLDYCAQLILLKKVGGGYIFIHRMLLEYFARLEPFEDNLPKTPITTNSEDRR